MQDIGAITASTDIAFFSRHCIIAGKRFPVSQKIFLTALAISDDLGAIVIIAQFYGEPVQVFYLPGAAVVIALLYMLHPQQVSQRQSLLRY